MELRSAIRAAVEAVTVPTCFTGRLPIAAGVPDLTAYDLILVNTSAGKDSALMAAYVTKLATVAGVQDRVLAVHATFGEEWPGTEKLAVRQCAALGIELVVVSRPENLLDYVERRGMWPSAGARFCTSEFKRAPIDKVITARAPRAPKGSRLPRVLNCMGIRAQESTSRATYAPYAPDARRSNTVRQVDEWLPIFAMPEATLWAEIQRLGLEMHTAYTAGMPRLSCVFCVFAPKAALLRAGELQPDLLDRYVATEAKIGHDFKKGFKIASVREALARGERASAIPAWEC